MTPRASFRGQPLLVLGAVLGGWLAIRVTLWVPPFAIPGPVGEWLAPPPAPLVAHGGREEPVAGEPLPAVPAGREPAPSVEVVPSTPVPLPVPWSFVAPPTMPSTRPPVTPLASSSQQQQQQQPRPAMNGVVGHNLLLLAGLSHMQVPAAIAAYLSGAQSPPGVPRAAPGLAATPRPSPRSRWSGDGWLLLRQDSAAPLLGNQPSYGRSQAGAVLRYQFAPHSAHRPQAYARASAALAGPREREAAAGLAARPLPGVPLRAAAEVRVSETAAGTEVRPAVYAVTELAPQPLPLGLLAEAYVQAGYVGGDYATGFIDGQARIERPLAQQGGAEFRAGAGAWGGAQKGANRLDIGPTAAFGFRLGEGRGRIAADYRFRVAGDAAPASGAALTLSAGF